MKTDAQYYAIGAGLGFLVAGVLAVILMLVDGCYEGDPGYGLPDPIVETVAKDGARE